MGEGMSHHGLGYFIMKTNNDQKVHGEGICWSLNFVSSIGRKFSETGVGSESIYGLLTYSCGVLCNNFNVNLGTNESDWKEQKHFIRNGEEENERSVISNDTHMDIEERKYREVWKRSVYNKENNNLKIHMLGEDLVEMITEGEKVVVSHEVRTTEDKGVPIFGLGYFIMKTNNGQKVQGEGVCWSIYLVCDMRMNCLETGVCTRLCGIRTVEDYCFIIISVVHHEVVEGAVGLGYFSLKKFVWSRRVFINSVTGNGCVEEIVVPRKRRSSWLNNPQGA
jgi:hypothetical protein